jgi:predicted RNase H-like HicB family nuclease
LHLCLIRCEQDIKENIVEFHVVIEKSAKRYRAWVPGLSRCTSFGASESEAVQKVRAAIAEHLNAANEEACRHKRTCVIDVPATISKRKMRPADLKSWFKKLKRHPMSRKFAAAVEKQVAGRRRGIT